MADRERRQSAAEMTLALVTTAVMTWSMLPDHEKTWLRLRLLHAGRSAAARLARRTAHRAMSDELAGRDYQRYHVAYWLSMGRDWAAAQIEAMRP